MPDDALAQVLEFLTAEMKEADGWTDVPPVYESGYVSALNVVYRHVERMADAELGQAQG